jgi:hypothetical protein
VTKTLFSPHWIPDHYETTDAAFFRDWRPRFVKILTNTLDVPHVGDVPGDAAIIVRHYPSSELNFQRGFAGYETAHVPVAPAIPDASAYYGGQGSGRDLLSEAEYRLRQQQGVTTSPMTPEQAAEMQVDIARQIAGRLRAQGYPLNRFWFEGINEPMFWSVEPQEPVARLERKRLQLMHAAGLNSVVLNAGVGWPGNGGVSNTPVQWGWFQPVFEVWGEHDMLGLHEYCGLNGPQENWGWWMGRYKQCPLPVPIVITETGIDGGVVPGQAGKGWLNLPPTSMREKARQYIGQLAAYEQELLKDARIRSGMIFTYDAVGDQWSHYNIKVSDWQIEWLAWLATRPDLPSQPSPIPPGPASGFAEALQEECSAHQVIFLNPNAALQKRLLADGFVPTSNEFEMQYDGTVYVAQRAERLSDGAVRGYYVVKGQWSNVKWMPLTA